MCYPLALKTVIYSAKKKIDLFFHFFSSSIISGENDYYIEDSYLTMLPIHLILFPCLVHMWEYICQ